MEKQFNKAANLYTLIYHILPSDLAFGDVHASLGHKAHSSLRLLTAEGAEVMNVRRLLRDLKVTNTAVPLTENTHIKCM